MFQVGDHDQDDYEEHVKQEDHIKLKMDMSDTQL